MSKKIVGLCLLLVVIAVVAMPRAEVEENSNPDKQFLKEMITKYKERMGKQFMGGFGSAPAMPFGAAPAVAYGARGWGHGNNNGGYGENII